MQEENEELKADLKGETEQCQKWYQLETDKHFQMLKYEQALKKIINIAEKLITETPEYRSCYYKDECGDNCTPKKQNKVEYCCYENVDKILTIINEVLNDRN